MGLGWKLALAGVGVYLAIPLVRRLSDGCPAFAAKSIAVPMVGGATSIVQACKPLSAAELFAWPLGFLAVRT